MKEFLYVEEKVVSSLGDKYNVVIVLTDGRNEKKTFYPTRSNNSFTLFHLSFVTPVSLVNNSSSKSFLDYQKRPTLSDVINTHD